MLTICDALKRGDSPRPEAIREALTPHLPLLAHLPAHARSTPTPPTLDALYEGLSDLKRLGRPISGERRLVLTLAAALHTIGHAHHAHASARARPNTPAPSELTLASRARDYLAPRLGALPLSLGARERLWSLVAYLHHPRALLRGEAAPDEWGHLGRLVDLADLSLLHRALCRAEGRGLGDAGGAALLGEHRRFEREAARVTRGGSPSFSVSVPVSVPVSAPTLTPNAPALHITCAPSGVGKSTWGARAHPHAAVVCMDEVRVELTGRAEDQSRNQEVFELSLERLKGHLLRGEEVVWDATSLLRAHRAPLIALGRAAGALTRLEVFLAPPAHALAGNLRRERVVPEAVIEAQYARWEVPARDEADEVRYLTPDDSGGWA